MEMNLDKVITGMIANQVRYLLTKETTN